MFEKGPKIKFTLPPIWDKIKDSPLAPNPDVMVFTYGDTIYVPSGRKLPDYLIPHEELHMKQQKGYVYGALKDSEAWWERYLVDEFFRLEQESDAYAKQYEFICKTTKNREHRNRVLLEIAGSLASESYGSIIGQMAAYRLIKEKSNV